MLRRICAALTGALLAGVLMGAAARLFMMLVALAAGDSSEFHWSATAGILLGFAAFMLPGALVAAFVRRRGRWLLLAAGAVVLLFPAVGVASDEIGQTIGFSTLNWVAVGLTGSAVFVTIAMLPWVTLRLVDATLVRLGVMAASEIPVPGGADPARLGDRRDGHDRLRAASDDRLAPDVRGSRSRSGPRW